MTLTRTFRLLSLLLALGFAGAVFAQSALNISVYKNQYCGCCHEWIKHLQKHGFKVSANDVPDTAPVRAKLGMPAELGSCHTATIGGYLIEGHVPAADIQRLLKEKPKAVGLAVPGMPAGSPGMESANPEPYNTLLVLKDGSTKVFAKH
ncbi:MAG: DUF411 domain-containing protein [Arenimonas sp.]|nr:DUF411 domain-containing protein [Arenimonas sp.]MBP7981663.1 DUF411 domain-containing protein [Arenimonas sp.]